MIPALVFMFIFGLAFVVGSFVHAAFGPPLNERPGGLLIFCLFMLGMLMTVTSLCFGPGGIVFK